MNLLHVAVTSSPFPEHGCAPCGVESEVGSESGGEEKISSPIRVSPERERSRSRVTRDGSGKMSLDGKLSVKERLYVSRQTIGL